MAENEKIGGVEIGVTADFSELDKQFQDAVAKAVAEGSTLGEAIAKATQAAAGDLGQMAQAVDKVGASLNQLGSATPPMEDIRSALAGIRAEADAAAKAAKDLEDATAQAKFEAFADNVEQWIKSPMRSAGEAIKDFILYLGPLGLAAGAAGAALGILGKEIVDLVLFEGQAAEKTQNLADRLNLTIDQTQKFSEMATVAGVSLSVLTRTSMRLAEAIDDSEGAGKKVAEALDGMGIAASNSGDLLVKVLEHLAAIPDATQRIAEAHQIMGRGAVELEPLLKNYDALSAAVDSLGGRLDSELIGRLNKADDAADLLGIAWGHLKENLAATFAPAVTSGIEMLTRLLSGAPTLTLDAQIEKVRGEIEDLAASAGRASIAVTSMMGGGFTSIQGTSDQLNQKQMQLDMLEGQKQSLAWSKEYNDAVDLSNRKAEQFKQAAAEAAAAAAESLRTFNNSIVGLFSLLPKTYDEYAAKLSDGGKTAKAALGEIEGALSKVDALSVGLSGGQLDQLGHLTIQLLNLRDTAKSFADQDDFGKIGLKMAELDSKFGTQIQEIRDSADAWKTYGSDLGDAMGESNAKIIAVFDGIADGSIKARDALPAITRILEEQKQIDTQMQTADKTFTKAWDTYETGARKAAGITSVVKEAAQNLEPDLTKLWETFDKGVQQGFQDGKDLNEAYKFFGLTLDETESKALVLFERMASGPDADKVKLESLEAVWARVSGQVQKLAQSDLPKALQIENEYIDALKTKGAAIGQIYDAEAKELQLEINLKSQTGADATAEIIALAEKKAAIDALTVSSQALGNVYKGLVADFNQAFDSLTKGIADNLVDWNNWATTLENIGKNLAKSLLETLLTGLFAPLKSELNVTGGLFDTLAKKLTGLVKGVGGGATGAVGDIANADSVSSAISGDALNKAIGGGSSATSSAGGAASAGGAGSLSSVLGIVGVGVAVASGVTQGIQGAQQVHLLGEIEVSTRQTKEQLVGGIQPILDQYLPELLHLVDIWGAVNAVNDQVRYGLVNVNVAEWGASSVSGDGSSPLDLSSLPPISPLGGADFTKANADQKANNENLQVLNQTYDQSRQAVQTFTQTTESASIALSTLSSVASAVHSSAPSSGPISGPTIGGSAGTPQRIFGADRSGPGGSVAPVSLLSIPDSSGGTAGAPAPIDFSARSNALEPVRLQYFALVPGATDAYNSGGDFKARFDAAWESLVQNGWAGDQKLDNLYQLFIKDHRVPGTGPTQDQTPGILGPTYQPPTFDLPDISGGGGAFGGTGPTVGPNVTPWGANLSSTPFTGGGGGGNNYITVNALNPSARGVARSLATAIQETGRSTK